MALITISRGSHSMGKAVAEGVAKRLGYECLNRDVLLEASDQYNIPEIRLEKAITDTPSILERFTHGRHAYVAYIRSALTQHMSKDNVVYHGLAGHVLLKNVSHLLKVRIIADIDVRVATVMESEKLGKHEAAAWINKLDKERRKWTKSMYGVDPWDPSMYDLLINIPRYKVDDAVELICVSANMGQFQTTTESQQQMADLTLACRVKAILVEKYHDICVASSYGNAIVYSVAGDRHAAKLRAAAEQLCGDFDGLNNIEVHPGVSPPASAV